MGTPVVLDTLSFLRRAAAAALLDSFDRRTTRDFFAQLISNALNLNENIRRYELTLAFLDEAETKSLTFERLATVRDTTQTAAEEYRVRLLAQAKLLMEMPGTDAVIN